MEGRVILERIEEANYKKVKTLVEIKRSEARGIEIECKKFKVKVRLPVDSAFNE